MENVWLYEISTGRFYDALSSSRYVGTGYSGARHRANDRLSVHVQGEGAIPPGLYRAGTARDLDSLGPHAIPLIPDDANEMFGRSGFYVHGDNKAGNRTASRGCIILNRSIRDMIDPGDLIVVV